MEGKKPIGRAASGDTRALAHELLLCLEENRVLSGHTETDPMDFTNVTIDGGYDMLEVAKRIFSLFGIETEGQQS